MSEVGSKSYVFVGAIFILIYVFVQLLYLLCRLWAPYLSGASVKQRNLV
jgi:hypothetical protein